MRAFGILFGLSLIVLSLNACRTDGVFVKETPLNISETRKSIVAVIGEPRFVSKDGRELDSNYYDKKGRPITAMESAKERLHSRIIILGDRRPYDLEVQVVVEARDENGQFEAVDKDDAMAKPLAEKIKKELYQSLDESNLIDDFRSF